MGHLVPLELVEVLLVLLVASFAEAEVLAGGAVETELPPLDGLLAAIAGEPGLIVALVLLVDALSHGLNELAVVVVNVTL